MYIGKNGLRYFEHPENVLLCSLAASIYKFAELPNTLSSVTARTEWLKRVRSSSSSSSSSSLTRDLLTDGGVLIDCSVEKITDKEAPHYVKHHQTLQVAMTRNNDNNNIINNTDDESPSTAVEKTTVRFIPKSGRYLFSSAHNAMLLNAFGVVRHQHNSWIGLEKAIFDFVTLVSAAAPYYHEMKAALQSEKKKKRMDQDGDEKHDTMTGANNNNNSNNNHKFFLCQDAVDADAMYPLKELLVFDDAIVPDDGKLRITSVVNVENMVSIQNKNRCFPAKQSVLRKVCGDVKNRDAIVVMLSAAREPFADVIVVGPNKVILIQCKSRSARPYYSSSAGSNKPTIDTVTELAKLNFGKDALKQTPSEDREAYFDELCRLCHDGESETVEVHAVLLVSTAERSSAAEHIKKTVLPQWNGGRQFADTTLDCFSDRHVSNKQRKTGRSNKRTQVRVVRKTLGICVEVPDADDEKAAIDPSSHPLFPALPQQSTRNAMSESLVASSMGW